ncbi:MAG: hypothetical protein BroJett040_11350 [Oligoflexia bacterium]|nr:MAG: hypothetical protein BroJett040_11350 [Oligoflexia bacterium]
MKTKLLLNVIFGILISQSVYADKIMMTKNQFIQIPIYDSYEIWAESEVKEKLQKQCGEFKKIMVAYEEMPESSQLRVFTSRREQPGEWQSFLESRFKVGFKIKREDLRDLLNKRDKSALYEYMRVTKPDLPFGTQLPMSVEVIDPTGASATVAVTDDSLSSKARKLGLKYGGVLVARDGTQFQVMIHALDLACDMLDGKAKLSLQTKVMVRPEVVNQDQIGQFYFDLSKIVTTSLAKPLTLRKKMGSLGYSIGQLLDQNGLRDQELQSIFVGNLMELLFSDDELHLSTVWHETSSHEQLIQSQKTTDGQVNLTLQIH